MKKVFKACLFIVMVVCTLMFCESKVYAISVIEAYDMAMLEKINNYRKENGLAPLEYDKDLVSVAEVRVKELPVSFEHKRPNGESYKTVYNELGLNNKFERGSENIAQFNVNKFGSGDEYVDAIFEAYTESESHNLNMLKPYWEYYGGSFLINCDGNSYQIQVFAR